MNMLEKSSLGGRPELVETDSETANQVLHEVTRTDPDRAAEAAPFFIDYLTTLKEMSRVLKSDAYACIVIGNRSIKRIGVDMGQVTIELGRHATLTHEKTYLRNIPKKMIPWTGPTGKTISTESIVVMRKS
jgi:hypothetical protein